MMSVPTDAQIKAYIVTSVGDMNGIVAANIDLIWDLTAPYAPYPPLHELYATRAAIDLLAGQVWQLVDASVDDTRQNLSDMHAHLMDRREDLDAQIAAATPVAMAAAGMGANSGQFVTVAPTVPPSGYPDANSPRYSGSPYEPYARVIP
jgi:hypothetical protein